jgi:hypothetical protein
MGNGSSSISLLDTALDLCHENMRLGLACFISVEH